MAHLLTPTVTHTPGEVPAALSDRTHVLWTGPIGAFFDYMDDHRWSLPARLRLIDCTAEVPETIGGPETRRRAAVIGWARRTGITDAAYPMTADYPRLTTMGLLDD